MRLQFVTSSLVMPIKFHKPSSICWPTKVSTFLKTSSTSLTVPPLTLNAKRETEHPRNTAKLTWEAEHIPLSVSVCSNVPGYDQPKCFVSSCFKSFGDAVSDARRAGDPSKAIIAGTMKLKGNSSYGKTITNKERHRQAKYCDDEDFLILRLLLPHTRWVLTQLGQLAILSRTQHD